MRPNNLHTKIFLDSGDVQETRKALEILGFLDGQTTNPTLVARSPQVQEYIQTGKRFTSQELLNRYKTMVTEISSLIPNGSVSIEVYATHRTTADEMFEQAKVMNSWIPNAHIKFPTSQAGLTAAEKCIEVGIKVNMTLAFDQQQAAAVYAATVGAKKSDVFYSSFVGRLYDNGVDGIANLSHVIRLYKEKSDGHVETLACSFRSYEQFLGALAVGADIITAPLAYLTQWAENGYEIPSSDFRPEANGTKAPEYQENIELEDKVWQSFEVNNQLTRQGIDKFVIDWDQLIR